MIIAVLSVTCRFNKNMATKKDFLSTSRLFCDEKRYIFRELNNVRKVMNFRYANTAYSCAGTDDCYYC